MYASSNLACSCPTVPKGSRKVCGQFLTSLLTWWCQSHSSSGAPSVTDLPTKGLSPAPAIPPDPGSPSDAQCHVLASGIVKILESGNGISLVVHMGEGERDVGAHRGGSYPLCRHSTGERPASRLLYIGQASRLACSPPNVYGARCE